MLEISLDVSSLVERQEAMVKKLEEFPKRHMTAELTAWQTEDMRRRFPNTKMPDEHTVETDIWPSSRTARVVERDQKKINAILRARKTANRPRLGAVRRIGTNRPILRSELYEKLVTRMDELMVKELSWR
jgi:hypothetical protein